MKVVNRGMLTIIGFIFFIIGFTSLFLMMIGIQYSFLTWIDTLGKLPGFLIRLALIIGGFIMVAADGIEWGSEE